MEKILIGQEFTIKNKRKLFTFLKQFFKSAIPHLLTIPGLNFDEKAYLKGAFFHP